MPTPIQVVSSYPLVTVQHAQTVILRETAVKGSEEAPLSECLGRILADDVRAQDDLPPFPASIKDGYAVVASDGTGNFRIAKEARAGSAPTSITAGSVAYITTGAPLPHGADAVVQVEDTEKVPGEDNVTILKAASPGQDIRSVGSDIQKGQLCMDAGEVLGPPEIGILAAIGAHRVRVWRRPQVVVMSTGDELREPHCSVLEPGQIRDSNRCMLIAACKATGAEVTDAGIVRDKVQLLEEAVLRCGDQGADVVVTSGGVSMGDCDHVKQLLEKLGTIHFGRVLMKPGKPLTFATLNLRGRRVLFFGLPGNPVSSIVCFHLFVQGALQRLAGHPAPGLRRVHVKLLSSIKLDQERPEFHRVILSWQMSKDGQYGYFAAASTGGQRSSRLLSVRSTTGLLELPQGTPARSSVAEGTFVPCLLIGDLRTMHQEPDPETDAG